MVPVLDPPEIGRLLLTLLITAGAGGAALAVLAAASKGRRPRHRRTRQPPPALSTAKPPRPPKNRQHRQRRAAIEHQSLALSEQISIAERHLSEAIRHRTHWDGVMRRLKERGHQPSSRTKHNFLQRSADVVRIATEIETLKQERHELHIEYQSICRQRNA